MIIYWIGVLIALCINSGIVFCIAMTERKIFLSNILWSLAASFTSWVEIGVLGVVSIIIFLSKADDIVIWQRREKE